jgi:hypothetical protein
MKLYSHKLVQGHGPYNQIELNPMYNQKDKLCAGKIKSTRRGPSTDPLGNIKTIDPDAILQCRTLTKTALSEALPNLTLVTTLGESDVGIQDSIAGLDEARIARLAVN